MKNDFVEIAHSQGKYFSNGIWLDFILSSNENPKVRSIYRLTIYPSMEYNQKILNEKEYHETLEYFKIISHREHLCSNICAVNNVIKSFVTEEEYYRVKFEFDKNNMIVGNIW